MKTIKTVEVTPEFVQFIPKPELMQEGVIYISKEFHTANHLCLCGCKNQTVTPIENHGYKHGGWTLTEKNDKISLSPSISNYQLPCKSHYVITNNKANFV